MSHEVLTSFFGWMAALNFAMLLVATLAMLALRDRAAGFHARLFNIDEAAARQSIYDWLGRYKVAALIFSIIPYFALRLM